MLITLVTVVSLVVVLVLAVRSLGLKVGAPAGGCWSVRCFRLALLTEPVRQTLGFGQVNVLLMVLVALDCLTRPDAGRAAC